MNNEKKGKSPIRIILMIIISTVIIYGLFQIYLNTFAGGTLRGYTQTPPTCDTGYGYTTAQGPTDGPIYSKCRKGPNKTPEMF